DLVSTSAKRKRRLDSDTLFATPGYSVLDLLATWHVSERLRLDGGLFNLTDRRYWTWADVQGRLATDPTLNRYTRAGRSLAINLSLEW
ncbi:MAG: TonB-dependent receptor, partial [Xanthomonadales bacterium]|nr:TonB-dependent receptor [Xanthomonadales bacterium]